MFTNRKVKIENILKRFQMSENVRILSQGNVRIRTLSRFPLRTVLGGARGIPHQRQCPADQPCPPQSR